MYSTVCNKHMTEGYGIYGADLSSYCKMIINNSPVNHQSLSKPNYLTMYNFIIIILTIEIMYKPINIHLDINGIHMYLI